MDAGVAALLGAGIGFGGSVILEMIRNRRENERWIRNEKKRIYCLLLDTLGNAIRDSKTAGEIGIPRVGLWETANYLGQLKLFTDPKCAQELTDLFIVSIWDSGEFVHYNEIITFNDTVTKAARKDLGI